MCSKNSHSIGEPCTEHFTVGLIDEHEWNRNNCTRSPTLRRMRRRVWGLYWLKCLRFSMTNQPSHTTVSTRVCTAFILSSHRQRVTHSAQNTTRKNHTQKHTHTNTRCINGVTSNANRSAACGRWECRVRVSFDTRTHKNRTPQHLCWNPNRQNEYGGRRADGCSSCV